MKIEKLNVKVKCDMSGCNSLCEYKIVNKKLVFNCNYYFCNKCLNELFGEIGKIILPKSPTPIFKKKGVKDE